MAEGRVLAVRNPRGWDVPGGHYETGEAPLESLARELEAEAVAAGGGGPPSSLSPTATRGAKLPADLPGGGGAGGVFAPPTKQRPASF